MYSVSLVYPLAVDWTDCTCRWFSMLFNFLVRPGTVVLGLVKHGQCPFSAFNIASIRGLILLN
jgi:hypothetical protein